MSPSDRRFAEVCDRIVGLIFIFIVLALSAGLFGE